MASMYAIDEGVYFVYTAIFGLVTYSARARQHIYIYIYIYSYSAIHATELTVLRI